MSDENHESIGSVAEEAQKLLGVLQDWAGDSGSEYAAAAAAAASSAASSLNSVNEHVAVGGSDCRYCPLCRVISAMRETRPEVKQHLASAATSLMHALAGAMATDVPDPSGRRRDASSVEKIDLSNDAGWENQ